MSFYPGNSSNSFSGTATRESHIDSLKQYFPATRELQRSAVYDVPVDLPQRLPLTIRVTLDFQFPSSPPIFSILPAVTHDVVDPHTQRVRSDACPDLAYWNANNLLGIVVFQLVQQFQRKAPQLAVAGSTNSTSYPPGNSTPASSMPSISAAAGTNSSSISTPSVPSAFPELTGKKPAELGELLNNEAAFTVFFNSLEGVKTMAQLRDDLKKGAGAGKTGADMEKLDADMAAAAATLETSRARLRELTAEQEKFMQQVSVESLIQSLDDLARDVEEETDDLAAEFTNDGDMDVREFKKKFLARRILYHTRAAKKESLSLKRRQ